MCAQVCLCTFIINAVLYTIVTVLCVGATIVAVFVKSLGMLVFGRVLIGYSLGHHYLLLSLFLEYIPYEHKGTMAVLVNSSYDFGGVMAVLLGWFLFEMGHDHLFGFNYRVYLFMCAGFAWVALVVAVFKVPSSLSFCLESMHFEKLEMKILSLAKINGTYEVCRS